MRDLNPLCVDCDVDTEAIREFFMVRDELWNKAVPDKTEREERVLCVGCLETRLGRELIASDFTDARVNKSGNHSTRLQARMTAP